MSFDFVGEIEWRHPVFGRVTQPAPPNCTQVSQAPHVRGGPAVQLPPLQTSFTVQTLWSLQGFVFGVCVHPVSGSQLSSVHPLLSLQRIGAPTHAPPEQVSPSVQALSSSHVGPVRNAGVHDDPGGEHAVVPQPSTVHSLPSSQSPHVRTPSTLPDGHRVEIWKDPEIDVSVAVAVMPPKNGQPLVSSTESSPVVEFTEPLTMQLSPDCEASSVHCPPAETNETVNCTGQVKTPGALAQRLHAPVMSTARAGAAASTSPTASATRLTATPWP
jgi:hypothetical protein